jgi:uncharacterized protein
MLAVSDASLEPAYASVAAEMRELLPAGGEVVDAHTHLGNDEDGMSLDLEALVEQLDQLGEAARACVFALHDPERRPAYRKPNDRVLEWAREADGRLYPFCRLDPADDPISEAQRCLARGARGIKLHPRAQAFGFGDSPAAEAIFEVAGQAGVPILIHAGRGMPTMTALADLALRYPEVALVLAHGGTADMGVFAARLADHPKVVYDTACMAVDLIELLSRVPVERIVFGSDPPYGRPAGGMFQALRVARYAGLAAEDVALLTGGTITALLEGRELASPTPPRVPQVRSVNGRLSRITSYVLMSFSAVVDGGRPPDPERALPGLRFARSVCRDPDPGAVGPALERIDALLAAAEQVLAGPREQARAAFGLIMAAGAIAATERVTDD